MMPILFQAAAQGTCSFGGLNSNDWVGISAAIIMASLLIASAIYVLAGFLPKREGDKIRGYVRFEYIQAMLSAVIIVTLLILASVTCNISASLTTPSQDPFSFAQHYVGTLLFSQGVGLETSMYATSIQFALWGGVISGGVQQLYNFIPGKLTTVANIGGFAITIKPPSDFLTLFDNYANVIIDLFIPLLIVSFSVLLIQFMMLPVISAVSLTVVLPVALIMRSLSFTGPKLRESANSFIAIAIALYFIYPLTFVMDNSIINWMYCTQTPSPFACILGGNPYPEFLQPYTLNNIQPSTFFASSSPASATSALNLPSSFYQTSLAQLGSSLVGGGPNPLNIIFYAPGEVVMLAQELAEYIFQATVLMALNLAVTIGFAYGIFKAMTGGLSFLGGEGFF